MNLPQPTQPYLRRPTTDGALQRQTLIAEGLLRPERQDELTPIPPHDTPVLRIGNGKQFSGFDQDAAHARPPRTSPVRRSA